LELAERWPVQRNLQVLAVCARPVWRDVPFISSGNAFAILRRTEEFWQLWLDNAPKSTKPGWIDREFFDCSYW
jgi:hypothetical protein